MEEDIVERLKLRAALRRPLDRLEAEAADEIAALRARVAGLEKALRTIGYGPPNVGTPRTLLNNFVSLARAALKTGEG